jgi:GAF domain-containing protein
MERATIVVLAVLRRSPQKRAVVTAPTINRLGAALELARAETAMDIAVLGEIRGGREVVHALSGDGTSFGLEVGASLPTQETYCNRLLEGRLPNFVHDARIDPRVNQLRLTRQARIGAYIGVPVNTLDARLYILCCLAHERRPRLCERDVLFMRGLAATIVAALYDTSAAGEPPDDRSSENRSRSERSTYPRPAHAVEESR